MSIEEREGKIFNLKPQLTLAMKLAATFAITYYGLLLLFEVVTIVFRRYYFDTYYFNEGEMDLGSKEFVVQIIQLALSLLLVFSLIQVFRKKIHGKAIFVGASLLLIAFQLIATGVVPWMKYALEVLLVLIIAPIRVKKTITLKDGQLKMETIEDETATEPKEEPEAKEEEIVVEGKPALGQDETTEASSQPEPQP